LCGAVSDNIIVSELPLPDPIILCDTLLPDGPLILSTRDQYMYYLWSNSSENPSIQVNQAGTFWVTVENEEGCTATDSLTIESWECEIFIPAAFTPNGDSYNDYFYVDGNNIDQLELEIFNRWGEKVYVTHDRDFKWDGTKKGQACAEGTYFYIISYNCTNFTQQIKKSISKGTITLLR
ncbi:MAG: gliding motility-associated C-terminal domain-containing protein, partial [Bacteroidales bacterium]|nr:gliding motility-associated C-terminal domain-containing protein [Bacteroidales bacterium]